VINKVYDWGEKLNGSNRYPQLSVGGQYAMLNYSLPLNSWHHVVFTFSTGVVTGYVDGVRVQLTQNTFTGTGSLPNNPCGMYLGTYETTMANAFRGSLDDVRVYSRALSANDVAALHSALSPVSGVIRKH
jgi:Concanavalin A-like lectin/glucanases superfamily